MHKLTIFILVGFIFAGLIFTKETAAVSVEEIRVIVENYPDSYFTNANIGIKNSFIKSLETIASNIDLFNAESDIVFMAELDQEIHEGIEGLIFKTNGCCIDGNNNYDEDDWIIDCQAQNEIYLKLNELLHDR